MQVREKLAEGFIWGAALLTVSFLVLIIGYIMVSGRVVATVIKSVPPSAAG
jgi:hypothetical protein